MLNNVNTDINFRLWKKIFFLIVAICIYRIGSYIPVSCVDITKLKNVFENEFQSIFNLVNLVSGGSLTRVSIFSLGVMPYISSSIVVQLLSSIIPKFMQYKKEGQYGHRKLVRYIRCLTVFVAFIQSFFMATYLSELKLFNPMFYYIVFCSTLVCGSMFLMWLGEQITEKGIGNGISILIFVGIVSNLPMAIVNTFEKVRQNELEVFSFIILGLAIFCIVFFVVLVECAQRKVTINHAKRQQGRKLYAAYQSQLPIKLNISGVIPPIFASGLILFPVLFFQWLLVQFSSSNFLTILVELLRPGKFLYIVIYVFGIVFFCFFYTRIIFNTKETAENLQKAGGYISGLRPGLQTADYIHKIVVKLTFLSAAYLSFISLVPEFLVYFLNVPFYFGGTSLLIVVIVVLDFSNQLQIYYISSKYEKMLKKSSYLNVF